MQKGGLVIVKGLYANRTLGADLRVVTAQYAMGNNIWEIEVANVSTHPQ